MDSWMSILAQSDDYGGELFYIIAVLILVSFSALFEKFKRTMAGKDEQPMKRPPAVPRRPDRPAQPPRPVSRPQPPRARPVGGETPPARPPVPARPGPAAPPRRPPAPPPRRPTPTRRRVVTDAPTPMSRAAPTPLRPVRPAERLGPARLEPEVEKSSLQVSRLAKVVETRPAALPQRPSVEVVPDVGSFRHLSIAEIRRAIVLSEILSPPLALRNVQSTWDQ